MASENFTSGSFGEMVVGFSKFHDYQLVPVSGAGYSVLYTVISGERKLFLKAVNRQEGSEAENLARLQREYKQMERLFGNDHIVRCIGWRDDPKVGPCIVMEYIDGMRLGDFLNTKPSSKERKRIFLELLDALEFIHDRQVVHNDLKLENIIITANGHSLKLIDFGYADNDANLEKATGGTKAFAAPELLQQEKTDCSSDIYSLGFIIKALFPHRYKLIAAKCLRKNPQKRYARVAEIRKAILRRNVAKWLFLTALLLVLLIWNWLPQNRIENDEIQSIVQNDTVVRVDSVFVVREIHDTVQMAQSGKQEVVRIVAPVDYGSPTMNFDSIHQVYLDLYQRYEKEIQKTLADGTLQYVEFAELYRFHFANDMKALHDKLMPKDLTMQFQFESDFTAAYGLFLPKIETLYVNKLPTIGQVGQTDPSKAEQLRIEYQKELFKVKGGI